jgi:hypothetical protein
LALFAFVAARSYPLPRQPTRAFLLSCCTPFPSFRLRFQDDCDLVSPAASTELVPLGSVCVSPMTTTWVCC